MPEYQRSDLSHIKQKTLKGIKGTWFYLKIGVHRIYVHDVHSDGVHININHKLLEPADLNVLEYLIRNHIEFSFKKNGQWPKLVIDRKYFTNFNTEDDV